MTRGEILNAMEQLAEEFWDQRNWELSLKGDNPVDLYNKYLTEKKSLANATAIEELPEHEKNWLRAT